MNDTTDGRQAAPGAQGFAHGWQGETRPISPATAVAGNHQILFDQTVFTTPPTQLFDPRRLNADGLLTGEATGRGKAWFLRYQEQEMVLRHFRRGGLMEKFLVDRYWGRNPANSRAWREWHLLLRLYRRGLPVPRPLAARVVAGRLFYRADLLTAAIPDADSLADRLTNAPLAAGLWQRLGAAIALFHRHDIYHPDLNARNILFDRHEQIFLIDFDQGEFRIGLNAQHNLKRLQRSLRKLRQNIDEFYYDESTNWPSLLTGYQQARQPVSR
ncbi:MAG: 3-deoxy-D-manno-octulosonic acid kinase [Desulfurivibrio sp.]|nr:3-deoxy-D-manno-octulosonic acid kinase [Desulfurivibrio sp.]